MSLDKIVYYTLETHPGQVFQSAEWCLESNIMMKKHELGIPIWTNHKILKNYEPDPNPEQDLITALSSTHDGNLNESRVVPQPAKKSRSRKKAVQLHDLQHVLDKFVPADNLPESKSTGTSNPVSDSLDQ